MVIFCNIQPSEDLVFQYSISTSQKTLGLHYKVKIITVPKEDNKYFNNHTKDINVQTKSSYPTVKLHT